MKLYLAFPHPSHYAENFQGLLSCTAAHFNHVLMIHNSAIASKYQKEAYTHKKTISYIRSLISSTYKIVLFSIYILIIIQACNNYM